MHQRKEQNPLARKPPQLVSPSVAIMGRTFIPAALGIIFIAIASRRFGADGVGVATPVIALAAFSGVLGRAGLDMALVNHMAGLRAEAVRQTYDASTAISVLLSASIAVIATAVVWTTSSAINSIGPFSLVASLVSLGAVGTTILAMTEPVAIHSGSVWVITIAHITASIIRIPLVFLLPSASPASILAASSLSFILGAIMAVAYVRRATGFAACWHSIMDWKLIRGLAPASGANLVGVLSSAGQAAFLPLGVLVAYGETASGHFYAAFTITTLALAVPGSFVSPLVARMAKDPASSKDLIFRAFLVSSMLLAAGLLLTILFAPAAVYVMLGPSENAGAVSLARTLPFIALPAIAIGAYGATLRAQRLHRELMLFSIMSSSVAVAGPIVMQKIALPLLAVAAYLIVWYLVLAIIAALRLGAILRPVSRGDL